MTVERLTPDSFGWGRGQELGATLHETNAGAGARLGKYPTCVRIESLCHSFGKN